MNIYTMIYNEYFVNTVFDMYSGLQWSVHLLNALCIVCVSALSLARTAGSTPSVMNSSLSKSLHAASPEDVSKALAELPPEERQKLQQALQMARPAPRWHMLPDVAGCFLGTSYY